MLSRSIKLILFLIVPIIITFFNVARIEDSSINLIDPNTTDVIFRCDVDLGGTSTITGEKLANDSYLMAYTLGGDGHEYPYAEMKITRKDSKFYDLTKYDKINVKLSSSSSKSLKLTAYAYLEGFTDMNNFTTYIPLIYTLETQRKITEINLDINNCFIPVWWSENNNVVIDTNKIPEALTTIIHLELCNIDHTITGVEDRVLLEKLSLTKDNRAFYIQTAKYILFYYILLIVVLFISRKLYKSKNLKFIKYKPLEITKETNTIQLIEDYIGSNYSTSQLSLTKVSEELNIPVKNLSSYINKKYNMSFPIYLNQIRINEAKKQLLNTDLKVVDIAICVGFNSAGHFNRVFKNLEFCTPREFRKQNKSILMGC